MFKVFIRRLIWMIPTLFVISVVTFTLMHLTPGGPWDAGEGRKERSAAVIANLDRIYHLDKSWPEQYAIYMWNALHGDLGPSFQFRDRNVSELLFASPPGRPWWESRFGRSMQLGLMAFLVGVSVGIPLGVLAAVKQNTWVDYFSLFLATIGSSLPSFVMAIFLIFLFGIVLKWFAVTNLNWNTFAWDQPATWTPWILPTLTLSFGMIAGLARLTRAMMLEVIRQDYIRTARSKGLAEVPVLVRHALKNAMIPVATVLGPTLAALITGSFFVELIFAYPGMGRSFVTAFQARDYSMIMGTTLFFFLLIATANLCVDLVYGWLDPRVKVGA